MAGVRKLVPEENSAWVKNLSVMYSGWCPILVPGWWLWNHCSLWAGAETRYCVHADVIVVDILVKLFVFHEEKPVEQLGEIIAGSTEADVV